MNHGLRLLREIHERLLSGVGGGERAPGEFRRSQNWIGGTRPGNAGFVPPPAHELGAALGNLERFLRDDPQRTPILLKAAVAHAQFETIHPFLDGNGRVGRLLITLLLCAPEQRGPVQAAALSQPLPQAQPRRLLRAPPADPHRRRMEEWVEFFLDGVIEVSRSATDTTSRIVALVERDRQRIHTLGRPAGSAARVREVAVREVVLVFVHHDYLALLNEGTEG